MSQKPEVQSIKIGSFNKKKPSNSNISNIDENKVEIKSTDEQLSKTVTPTSEPRSKKSIKQSENDVDMAKNKDTKLTSTDNDKRSHYCYILRNHHDPDKNRTYNGYTVDPVKRIRQHNQEIKGGAKYTKVWGEQSWEIYVVIKGFPDHHNALQCEWRIKHPAPKRVRPARYNSPEGRVVGLSEILQLKRWTSKSTVDVSDLNLDIWIVKEFSHLLVNLPKNITLHAVDKIDLTII